MRKITMIVMGLLVCSLAFAATGNISRVFNSDTVETEDTVTSRVFSVKSGGWFGTWYKATSATATPDVKIVYEMSYDGTAGNFVEVEDSTDIVTNLTDETAHVESIQPPPMRYMRFKATGNAGNTSDTVVSMYLFEQEN